jgi:Bacterial Ig domain
VVSKFFICSQVREERGFSSSPKLLTLCSGVSTTICVALCLISSTLPAMAQNDGTQAEVTQEEKHDLSPPLRDIEPPIKQPGPPRELPFRPWRSSGSSGIAQSEADPVLQTSPSTSVAITTGNSFDGVGDGLVGPNGTFTVNSAPPDTNGSIGATQYVQWVNTSFAVFDKTNGAVLYGPVVGNTLWKGFGGSCETRNDGDIIAQYDKAANRWVMMQPVFSSPYMICLAVSTTSDATGTYNRYAFSMPNFPDYPKLGVWPDGYYMSFNMFQGNKFVGGRVCALDRGAMLTGAAATQHCFQLSSSFGGLLPSDLDGVTPPPAGSPNYFLNFGSNSLNLWKFHVDFQTPSNSTLTGPINISVASFNEACGGRTCIPQTGTTQLLDSLADRLMYRLAYRNFPNDSSPHESLVVTHSVNPGTGNSAIRWYELRNPGGTPTVYQQSTFAPDSDFRWMGSIAMDKVGDILVGYSDSSSSIHPGIRYTGRGVSDPLNTMQIESSFIFAGGGSQTTNLSRWGDYSSMSIDPVDDCTFWYTQEYLKNNGTFNWSTRVSSASFPSCFQLPSPPTVYVDAPTAGTTVSGTMTVVGWATDNSSAVGTAINSVQVRVDGTVVGTASYGLSRPDVCAVLAGRPGCPNVGYSYSLNTSALSVGTHTITVTATDSDVTPDAGSSSVTVNVQNPPPTVDIDTPTPGSTVSGTVAVSGWALDNSSIVGTAISSVQVKVDGTIVGTATYGFSRPDVCAVLAGRPGCPNVGYSFSLNTSALSVGTHTITVTATDSDTTPDTGAASVSISVTR